MSSKNIYVDILNDFRKMLHMFIRVNKTPNSPRRSIQIVESIRTGDKVKQKIVHYVGIANDEDEEQKLKDYGLYLIAKIKTKRLNESQQTSLFPVAEEEMLEHVKSKAGRKKRKRLQDIIPPEKVSLSDIKEQDRIVEGIHEVGNAVYNMLGYDSILQKRDDNILRDLVLARLASPASKHKTQRILSKQFGKEHDLDSIYRMMDKLYDRIDDVKKCTFEQMRSLFPNKVDLVLFDVTTLYFETVETDGLRNFGYSKDLRFNTSQVVLALATNEDGLPIGYELFEGNKAEVKTLSSAIEHWKTLFNIGEVCFVGDRAMFTRDNLSLLESHGYKYIVAAKLRSLSDDVQEQVLDDNNYKLTVLKNTVAWINELDYENKRLIVSYKKQRAINDSKEREKILNKIKKLIGNKGSTKSLLATKVLKNLLIQTNHQPFLMKKKLQLMLFGTGCME